MKRNLLVLALILAVIITTPESAMSRIRCGNDLISVGDTAFDVKHKLGKCEGQILDRQVIEVKSTGRVYLETDSSATFTTRSTGEERWYLRVYESPGYYCYNMIFIQGRLDKIEGWERCE